MLTIDTPTEWMFLPDDGPAAEAKFLELLDRPGETWISMYGFTLQPVFDRILAADARGDVFHILLDHTQATGAAEAPKVKHLAENLRNGDVTITTAGCHSAVKSAIWHEKVMIVAATDGGEYHCWQGSINISGSGFNQGNTGSYFRSDAWAQQAIANITEHRDWARANEPQYQLPTLAVPVAAGEAAVVTGPPEIVPVPGGTA